MVDTEVIKKTLGTVTIHSRGDEIIQIVWKTPEARDDKPRYTPPIHTIRMWVPGGGGTAHLALCSRKLPGSGDVLLTHGLPRTCVQALGALDDEEEIIEELLNYLVRGFPARTKQTLEEKT